MSSEIKNLFSVFPGFDFQLPLINKAEPHKTIPKTDRFERPDSGHSFSPWSTAGDDSSSLSETKPKIPKLKIVTKSLDSENRIPTTIVSDTFSGKAWTSQVKIPINGTTIPSTLKLPFTGITSTSIPMLPAKELRTKLPTNDANQARLNLSLSEIQNRISLLKSELLNFDVYKNGLEAREELVQELNDLIDRQNQLLSASELKSKGIRVKFAGNVSSKEATEIGQSLNVQSSILEKYNVKKVISAHAGDGTGVWRINGISETAERIITSGNLTAEQKIEKLRKLGNLDLVGGAFTNNLKAGESVCVLGCKGKNGTSGFIFTKKADGEVKVESIDLSEAKELAGGIRLGDSLEQRYQKLCNWAKDQQFITVYRAEGATNPSYAKTGELTGSWYGINFEHVKSAYYDKLPHDNRKLYALIIPRSSLELMPIYEKALGYVNIINPDLIAGRIEIQNSSDSPKADLETYLSQFSFVKEYKNLSQSNPSKARPIIQASSTNEQVSSTTPLDESNIQASANRQYNLLDENLGIPDITNNPIFLPFAREAKSNEKVIRKILEILHRGGNLPSETKAINVEYNNIPYNVSLLHPGGETFVFKIHEFPNVVFKVFGRDLPNFAKEETIFRGDFHEQAKYMSHMLNTAFASQRSNPNIGGFDLISMPRFPASIFIKPSTEDEFGIIIQEEVDTNHNLSRKDFNQLETFLEENNINNLEVNSRNVGVSREVQEPLVIDFGAVYPQGYSNNKTLTRNWIEYCSRLLDEGQILPSKEILREYIIQTKAYLETLGSGNRKKAEFEELIVKANAQLEAQTNVDKPRPDELLAVNVDNTQPVSQLPNASSSIPSDTQSNSSISIDESMNPSKIKTVVKEENKLVLISDQSNSANRIDGILNRKSAVINSIHVDEKARGRGIGKQLLLEFRRLIEEKGITKVYVDLTNENVAYLFLSVFKDCQFSKTPDEIFDTLKTGKVDIEIIVGSNKETSNSNIQASASNGDISSINLRVAEEFDPNSVRAQDVLGIHQRCGWRGKLTKEEVDNILASSKDLSGYDLSGMYLRQIDLRLADLSYTNLRESNLSSANLTETNFTGANLDGANLSFAKVFNANFTNTSIENIKGLESALGIETVNFTGAEPILRLPSNVTYIPSRFQNPNKSRTGDYHQRVNMPLLQRGLISPQESSSAKFHPLNLSLAKVSESNILEGIPISKWSSHLSFEQFQTAIKNHLLHAIFHFEQDSLNAVTDFILLKTALKEYEVQTNLSDEEIKKLEKHMSQVFFQRLMFVVKKEERLGAIGNYIQGSTCEIQLAAVPQIIESLFPKDSYSIAAYNLIQEKYVPKVFSAESITDHANSFINQISKRETFPDGYGDQNADTMVQFINQSLKKQTLSQASDKDGNGHISSIHQSLDIQAFDSNGSITSTMRPRKADQHDGEIKRESTVASSNAQQFTSTLNPKEQRVADALQNYFKGQLQGNMPESLIKDLTVLIMDPKLSNMSPEEQQQHFESTFAKATFEELIKWSQGLPKEKAGLFVEGFIRVIADPRFFEVSNPIKQIAIENLLQVFAHNKITEAAQNISPGVTKDFIAQVLKSSYPGWDVQSSELEAHFNKSISKQLGAWLQSLPATPLKPLLLEIYNQVQSGQAVDEKLVSESFIKSQINFFALQQWIDKKPVFRRLLNVMQDEAFFKLSPKERAINLLCICTKDCLSNLGSQFQAKVVEVGNEKITRRQLFTNIWQSPNSFGDSKADQIKTRL